MGKGPDVRKILACHGSMSGGSQLPGPLYSGPENQLSLQICVFLAQGLSENTSLELDKQVLADGSPMRNGMFRPAKASLDRFLKKV